MSKDHEGGDDEFASEDLVYERRLERRLRRIQEADRPWLRRTVGVLIILITLFVGWRLIVARNQEIVELHRQSTREFVHEKMVEKNGSDSKDVSSEKSDTVDGFEAMQSIEAFLDAPTVTTIAECTKGVDAFRLLNVSKESVAKGEATLDTVFAPVLQPKLAGAKRQVNLLNIRILDQSGKEIRLHVLPEGESGKLRTKLFGVDLDGLPDPEVRFSEEIEKLRGIPYSEEVERTFLKFGQRPGKLLETELHESFSYRDRSGLQIIRSNGRISELQVFANKKFLACTKRKSAINRDTTVDCKCLDRSL